MVLIAAIALLAKNNVPQHITEEDAAYIRKTIEDAGYDFESLGRSSFAEEIKTVRAVQDAIIKQTPEQNLIPHRQSREPKDLYGRGYALCGDRSRFLHKALRFLGFEARYASLYDTSQISSPVLALLSTDKSKVRSHAMIEVKTSKGLMMVDSVTNWIGLGADETVYSFEEWQNHPAKNQMQWAAQDGELYYLLNDDFTYIYGLYSRHGQFYPPYLPLPDINWAELTENFR